MHIKNSFRTILFNLFGIMVLCFGLIPVNLHTMGMPMGNGGMPMGNGGVPTPEDLQQIEAEIDRFVQSLPPEQQAQFYKDVEELTGIMEKMSPDELNEFVGSVFSEAGLIEPMQEEAVIPEVTAPVKEEKPAAPLVTPAATGPTEKAIAMLDSIINSTEEFLRKTSIIVELPGKMNKWIAQKKLRNAPAQLSWESMQTQIEELNTLLYTLQEKDPKTGQYRHIGNLLKNEALYNNLAKLQVTLQTYVPLVTIPDFGLEKVSKESRGAIREVLNQYLEAFNVLNVITDIKKVQQLYEGRAKELTDEEKKLADQAKKESEKTRRQSEAVRSSGTAKAGNYGAYSNPYDFDYGYGGSSPYSYSPSSFDYEAPTSSYTPSSSSSGGAGSKSKSGGKAGEAGKSGEASDEDKGGKGGKGGEGKGDKESTAKGGEIKAGGAKKPEVKKDSAKDRELARLQNSLEETVDKFKEFGDAFTEFEPYIANSKGFDKKVIDDQLADIVLAIQTADKQLKKATGEITKFKKFPSSMNKATQDHYKKELKDALKDSIKFYDKLSSNIKTVAQNMAYASYKNKVNADKLYIYFGEDSRKVSPSIKAPTVVPSAPTVTMNDLDKTIEAFLKEAK